MVRSSNTEVNRATGQVLQSKISAQQRGQSTFLNAFVDARVFGTLPDPHNGSGQVEQVTCRGFLVWKGSDGYCLSRPLGFDCLRSKESIELLAGLCDRHGA